MRNRINSVFKYLLVGWLLLISTTSTAADIRVAVASNFTHTLEALRTAFTQSTGHRIVVIPGSTGKLYAQIRNGAPFDVFLAADRKRPEILENESIAQPGSRFTYAIGRLALWQTATGASTTGPDLLSAGTFEHLAIANPRLAPYGRAAKETLEKLGRWQALQPRLVRGENAAQAYRYVRDGMAEVGFVAASHLQQESDVGVGSFWLVPQDFHSPIEQQAVRLSDKPAAKQFMRWLRGEEATRIIRQQGYEVQ